MKKFILAMFIPVLIVLLFPCKSFAKESPPIELDNKPLNLWMPYDEENPDKIQNYENRYIFIDSDELKAIEDAKNPTKKDSGDPPENFQVSAAKFYSVVDRDYVNISGSYDIEKMDDDWILVPFISDTIGISSASLDNKAAFITKRNSNQDLSKFKNSSSLPSGYYFLALKEKGNHKLKFNFSVPVNKDQSINTKSFSYNIPNIPITNITCIIKNNNQEINVPQAISSVTKNVEEGTKLFATFPPTNNILVKWNPKSTIDSLPDKLKTTLPPSITATTYSSIEVGRGTLKGTFTANIDIRHAALDQFNLFIPEGVEIDSITASNNTEIEDPSPPVKNNLLPVKLTSAVEGKITLIIKYRKNFDGPSFITKIPAITLLNKNIDREVGYVGVVETTNIESTIKEADETKNYQEIDSSELTGPLSGMRASIAFKYQKNKDKITTPPYDLTMSVVRHQDVAVYEANIKSTNITSIVNENGQIFTKAILNITNTRKQFLTIQLPEDSSIWSVYIDNRSIKPAIQDEKKNIYSIPLAKSSASDNGGKTFPIEIVYYTNKTFLLPTWLFGAINLKALNPELASNEVTWSIYLPQTSKFFPIDLLSNLQQKKIKTYPKRKSFLNNNVGSLRKMKMKMKKIQSSMEPNIQAPMPEEESQMDYSQQRSKFDLADSIVGRRNYSSSPQKLIQQKQIFKSKKAGKLPVYVNLPEVGTNYNFYQISFQANKTPNVFCFYANNTVTSYIFIAFLLIAGFLLISPIRNKQFKSWKFIVPFIIFTTLLYQLISFYIIIFAVLLGIYFINKMLCYKFNDKQLLIKYISSATAIIIILLYLAALIQLLDLCIGVLFVLLVIIISTVAIVWVLKLLLKYLKKRKIEPEPENTSDNQSETEEVQND